MSASKGGADISVTRRPTSESDPQGRARNARLCVPIPTLRLKEGLFVSFRTDRPSPFRPACITELETVIGWGGENRTFLITDMPRDRYVERCKQRAFDYLGRGDLKDAVASFVSNMNARPDCELPHYLAMLGVLLLRGNDAPGLRTLIEGVR
jgi:hypothetical protein